MKLYLVRHATASERIGGAVKTDAERPLVDDGRKEAEQVAHALRKIGVKPDAYLTSPLVRARQTAEIMAEVLSDGERPIFCDALAPGGSADELYKAIATLRRANEVMIFGHQPDMSALAGTLLLAGPEFDMPFKKAAVARIDVVDLPPTTPGTLKWFITPKFARHL